MKATQVTAGLAKSNGSLLPGLWRDSLHVTCGLTACTPGSAPGPTLGNEYGKTLPLPSVNRLWHTTKNNEFRFYDEDLVWYNVKFIADEQTYGRHFHIK